MYNNGGKMLFYAKNAKPIALLKKRVASLIQNLSE